MLEGKSAVVTGSTSGIGLDVARKLASQGANVALNGFGNRSEIDAIVKKVRPKVYLLHPEWLHQIFIEGGLDRY